MAAFTDQIRDGVLGQLRGLLPDIDDTTLRRYLTEAVATQARVLRQLADHLREHPDALTSASPRCPGVWVRLTHVLHAAGHTHIARPGCAVCRKITVELPRITTAGRICLRCHQRAHPPLGEP